MSQYSVKTLKEVIRNLIQPKGVKRKANVEGSELLNCEGECHRVSFCSLVPEFFWRAIFSFCGMKLSTVN